LALKGTAFKAVRRMQIDVAALAVRPESEFFEKSLAPENLLELPA
jgi:hypothetical protein